MALSVWSGRHMEATVETLSAPYSVPLMNSNLPHGSPMSNQSNFLQDVVMC